MPAELPLKIEYLDLPEVLSEPDAYRCIGQEQIEQLDVEPAQGREVRRLKSAARFSVKWGVMGRTLTFQRPRRGPVLSLNRRQPASWTPTTIHLGAFCF